MVNARTWFSLFIISLGTVAATASCGSDEGTGGAGGSGSVIAGGGRAGSTGRAGSNGAGVALGSECTTDTQCGVGLICVRADSTLFAGAGPAKGMCTMACEPGKTECGALKQGAECFNFGTVAEPKGYCLDGCDQGRPVDVSTKCQGRSDFVCADVGEDAILPFCIPHCRSDAECGTGLFCDKSKLLGLCSKTKPPAGDPVGAECTPSLKSNTCEGYCLRTSADGVTPVTGMCVELCSGGAQCMYGSGNSPVPGGLCVGALSDNWGAVDLGYCEPNCSCSGDCKFAGDLCRKWAADETDLAEALGAPGLCYPNLSESVELSCGEGGAGGAGGESAGGAGGESGAGGAGGDSAPGTGGVAGSD